MEQTSLYPIPSPAQLAWQRTETNLFIHFGMNTFTRTHLGTGKENPALFDPAHVDCAQWARVAREAGFQIAILTAKHHDGFCLWPCGVTDHSVASSPWRGGRGDLVREFVEAFRAQGLKVGLYLSPWDRHEPSYGTEAYNDFYCRQLTELLTQYGELHEVWFDGCCAEGPTGQKQVYDWPRFFHLVRKLQPNAVTFGDGGTDVRWVGNERGVAGNPCWATVNPEYIRFPGDSGICETKDAVASVGLEKLLQEGQIPDGKTSLVWRPAECDVSIRPAWFYLEEEDAEVRSIENLVDLYFQSVGRNGTLLLNIPPKPDGLFHPVDIRHAIDFRHALDALFEKDLAQESKITANSEDEGHAALNLTDGNENTYWSAAAGAHQAVLEIHFPESRQVAIFCLQEAIQLGQRIKAFHVDGKDAGGDWHPLFQDTTVGHKKLHRIPPITLQAVRVVIDDAVGSPALSRLALHP